MGSCPAQEFDHGMGPDEVIEDDVGSEDANMDAVNEAESEEEMWIVHEDVEDEMSSILLAQMGQSSKSCRRELAKGCRQRVSELHSPPRTT